MPKLNKTVNPAINVYSFMFSYDYTFYLFWHDFRKNEITYFSELNITQWHFSRTINPRDKIIVDYNSFMPLGHVCIQYFGIIPELIMYCLKI